MATETPGSVRKTIDSVLASCGLTFKSSDSFSTKIARIFAFLAPLKGSKTHDFASIADGAEATTTVTVTGAAVGDFAQATISTLTVAGVIVTAVVTAANTVTVNVRNDTGAPLDLGSGTLRARVHRA